MGTNNCSNFVADIWICDHEQYPFPVSVSGSCLLSTVDMGLFSRSISNSTCLLSDGPHCKLSHNLSTLDVFVGLCALSILVAVGVCS